MTFTGLYVEPLDLEPSLIRVEDVAHALSNQCRFSGHVREFYSVAEHSVRVTRALESGVIAGDVPLDVLRWGLMHDAAEAYLTDVARPLKDDAYFGRAYRGAEARAMTAVAERFELEGREPSVVKVADMVLLATERRDLLPANGTWGILDGVEPLETTIRPWTPKRAERAFLATYEGLFGKETG